MLPRALSQSGNPKLNAYTCARNYKASSQIGSPVGKLLFLIALAGAAGLHPGVPTPHARAYAVAIAPAVDSAPAHTARVWTAPSGSVPCPPLPDNYAPTVDSRAVHRGLAPPVLKRNPDKAHTQIRLGFVIGRLVESPGCLAGRWWGREQRGKFHPTRREGARPRRPLRPGAAPLKRSSARSRRRHDPRNSSSRPALGRTAAVAGLF